ncbi:GNAT family N-acetyltransferase [bacterium]|nr:GNAT family N-acetyltransferase [bacterium]
MIRPATVLDAPAIAEIWNPWIRDTAVTFNAIIKTPEEVAALIVSRQTAGHGFLVAADEEDGAILGFATYGQFRLGVGYARTMEHSIILAPAARGKGLGRALLTAIERHAAEEGAHQILAGVSAENAEGLRFHQAMGYAECARIREAGHKFDRYMDLVLMQKFLS